MHMIKTYEGLRSKLEREVEDFNKMELSEKNVETLCYILKSLKEINCLIDYESQYEDNGNSYRYNPQMSYGGSYGRYGRDGDGDGRYNESSRDNFRYSTDRGWNSRDYSRDNARQKMVQKLETLKDDTMSEHDRQAIDNCIRDINK